MKRLVVILLLVSSSYSLAQKGFLGKKFTFTFGTSFAPPMLNGAFEKKETDYDNGEELKFDLNYNWSALPEISGEIGYTVTEKLHLTLFGSFRRLQSADLNYSNTSGEYFGNFYVRSRVTDSLSMQTNNFQLGMSFKVFREYAPVGKYFLASLGYARTSSKINGSGSTSASYNYGEFIPLTSEKLDETTYHSNHVFISLGYGKSTMVHKHLLLDFGFKASFHYLDIFNFSYYPEIYDVRNRMPQLVKKIHVGNLNSSYLMQFYLKFGLIY